jgi:hypothetical protein
MAHYCRICCSSLTNEKFSGGGHRIHVCRECQRLPSDQREAIQAEHDMYNFLYRQSPISAKNLNRLRLLAASKHLRTAELASLVLAVALATPGKRKRLGRLRHNHPDLFEKLEALGFLPPGIDAIGQIGGDDPDFESEFDPFEGVPFLPLDPAHAAGLDEEIPY